MRISVKTSFPYPVLGHRKGISSTVDLKLDGKQQDDYYIWDIDIIHDNEDINNLVRTGKAKYVCEVDCVETYYRKTFYPEMGGNEKHIRVKIHNTDIGGVVAFCVTALAIEKIPAYHNSQSTGIYVNYSFNIEPGDILAVFGGWDIPLDDVASSYKRITSILQLHMVDGTELEVDLSDKKHIIIELPKERYSPHIDKLKNPYFQPALLSSIVFEALCRAFQHLSENETKTWARVLEHKARELGYEEVKEKIKDDPDIAYEITRRILEDPYAQLFSLLDDIRNEQAKEND